MSDSLENLADQLAADEATKDAAGKPPESGGPGNSGANDDFDENKDKNLKMILDIPLRVTVELGRTKMVVNELLNLGQGSVIELAKLAGEPMEVFVNDKLIARGEAVVVNEKFGVRLTDIISTKERVEQLG
jgi:flagellar motor switch protein FliN/FliY